MGAAYLKRRNPARSLLYNRRATYCQGLQPWFANKNPCPLFDGSPLFVYNISLWLRPRSRLNSQKSGDVADRPKQAATLN